MMMTPSPRLITISMIVVGLWGVYIACAHLWVSSIYSSSASELATSVQKTQNQIQKYLNQHGGPPKTIQGIPTTPPPVAVGKVKYTPHLVSSAIRKNLLSGTWGVYLDPTSFEIVIVNVDAITHESNKKIVPRTLPAGDFFVGLVDGANTTTIVIL